MNEYTFCREMNGFLTLALGILLFDYFIRGIVSYITFKLLVSDQNVTH